jgi:hypothetical protein
MTQLEILARKMNFIQDKRIKIETYQWKATENVRTEQDLCMILEYIKGNISKKR